MKIAIVIGSIRNGRNGEQVANYVFNYANSKKDENTTFELVDLKSFDLPLLGMDPSEKQVEAIQNWSKTMASFDGYIFVTPEYNRAVGGAFKNALDFLKPELKNKAVGYVGYGGLGGAFAIASLRGINAEVGLASVATMVTFSLITDFENFSVFKPADHHAQKLNDMISEVLTWSKALKTIR